jgi:hypothetical protein
MNFEQPPLEKEPEKEVEETSTQEVAEKTEQSVRILSTLWDKRLGILEEYYKERNKKRFNPFKSEKSVQSEIKEILSKITPINSREEKVVKILEGGAISGVEILKKNKNLEKVEGEHPAISEFNEKFDQVSKINQRYTELVSSHKDILKIEKELIESPDEKKFELYIKRMEMFSSEFSSLDQEKNEELNKYFSDIESDLKMIEEAKKRTKPLEYLAESCVSAFMRVIVSQVIAAGMTYALGNEQIPKIVQLTALTIPTVVVLNYIDSYFKIFTKITHDTTEFGKKVFNLKND